MKKDRSFDLSFFISSSSEERTDLVWDVAAAAIFGVVVLVIFFSFIELGSHDHLGGDWIVFPLAVDLFVCDECICKLHLFFIGGEDDRAVLGAVVRALSVALGWVMDDVEMGEQFIVRNHRRVVGDHDGFGVS